MLIIDSTYRNIYLDGTEEQHDSSLVRIPFERRIEKQATVPEAGLDSKESVGLVGSKEPAVFRLLLFWTPLS